MASNLIVISTCNELTEAAKCFRKQRRALIYDKGVVSSDITQANVSQGVHLAAQGVVPLISDVSMDWITVCNQSAIMTPPC